MSHAGTRPKQETALTLASKTKSKEDIPSKNDLTTGPAIKEEELELFCFAHTAAVWTVFINFQSVLNPYVTCKHIEYYVTANVTTIDPEQPLHIILWLAKPKE